MRKKKFIYLLLPFIVIGLVSCNKGEPPAEVITAKKLNLEVDPQISYIPLNSEYMPNETVTFEITSNKLSSQEFKVYLNDELLIGITEKTYVFSMPFKDSILKAQLVSITKEVKLENNDYVDVTFEKDTNRYSINQEVLFNINLKKEYENEYVLKSFEAYYMVDNAKTTLGISSSSYRDFRYGFFMPKYDVILNFIYEAIPKYNVTLKNSANIEIKLKENKNEYIEGSKVAFTLSYKNGAILKEVKVTDSNNLNIPVISENTEYYFYMGNSPVTISVKEKDLTEYYVTSIVGPKYGSIIFINEKSTFLEGDIVKFKVNVKSGYKFKRAKLSSLDGTDLNISIKHDVNEDYYYFTMPNEGIYLNCEFSVVYNVIYKGSEYFDFTLLNSKNEFNEGDKVEFSLVTNNEKYILENPVISYLDGTYSRSIDYTLKNGVYSFVMPSASVTVDCKYHKASDPTTNPFYAVSRFETAVTETSYDEWDEYEVTTLTFKLAFDFNGDGTYTYSCLYVEGNENKKTFQNCEFAYDDETSILTMALGFTSTQSESFVAIKDSSGFVSGIKALKNLDPHNGIYTIKTGTIFRKI